MAADLGGPSAAPALKSFLQRHGGELVVALFVLAVGVIFDQRFTASQERSAERLATRQEVIENVRFVRERASPEQRKPFAYLRFERASLDGLDLSCQLTAGERGVTCADFRIADLRGASFRGTDLRNANLEFAKMNEALLEASNFSGANLRGARLATSYMAKADLRAADLSYADLSHAVLDGAQLQGANLAGTNMANADLSDAILAEYVCQDSVTVWPKNFDPPPYNCSDWPAEEAEP